MNELELVIERTKGACNCGEAAKYQIYPAGWKEEEWKNESVKDVCAECLIQHIEDRLTD